MLFGIGAFLVTSYVASLVSVAVYRRMLRGWLATVLAFIVGLVCLAALMAAVILFATGLKLSIIGESDIKLVLQAGFGGVVIGTIAAAYTRKNMLDLARGK